MSAPNRLWDMRQSVIALAILASLLLVACGAGSSPGASSSPGTSGGVAGRTFLSTAVEGQTLVPGSRIRLAFENGQLSATAGCNTMSGAYRIEIGTLRAPQLATTEMGCDQRLMAQDQWVGALFDGASIALDGNSLTLARNGVKVTLLDRVVADPDRPLLGTRWVVDGLLSGGTAQSVPAGATAALTFHDGGVDIDTGCNSGGADATISDGSIAFGPITLTKRACVPAIASLEMAVLSALQGTASYGIVADSLTITSGGHGLSLRAAP